MILPVGLRVFPSNKRNTQQEEQDDDIEVQNLGMQQVSAVYGPGQGRSPLSFEDLPDERTYQNPSPYTEYYPMPTTEQPVTYTSEIKVAPTGRSPTEGIIKSPETAATVQRQPDNINDSSFQNVPLDKTLVQYPHESIEQPRRSQVIRKINSGFEILRPGTFGASRKKSGTVLGETDAVEEQDNKRYSRRLYRKRGSANLGKS